MSQRKAAGGDRVFVMQHDHIRRDGQPMAIVLAETQEQADHAQSLVTIDYEPEPVATAMAEAKAKGVETRLFMGEPLKLKAADAEVLLAAAPHRVDAAYATPRHNHRAG